MSAYRYVGRQGAAVQRDEPTTGLLGCTDLGGAGLLAIDLLRPEEAYAVTLTATQMSDPRLNRLPGSVGSAGEPAPGPPDLLLRLACVEGVARWSTAELDEGLVQADRAAAMARAALSDGDRDLFLQAEPSVTALVQRLVDADESGGPPCPVPLRAELLDVLALAAASQRWARELRELAEFIELARGDAPLATVAPAVRPDDLQILPDTDAYYPDPLHIPARVLLGPVEVRRDGNRLTVRCHGFPGVAAAHPAADRLLVRVVDAVEGRPIAVSPFALDAAAGVFEAEFALPPGAPDRLLADVFDALSATGPRYTAEGRSGVDELRRAQSAFTALRDAAARRTVGDDAGAATSRLLAEAELGRELGDADDRRWRTAALRPLLCELDLLVRR